MIRFFFEYNKQVIQLPINPESIEIPGRLKNEIKSILTLGQIAIEGETQLKTFKITSFFPKENNYPFILTKGDFEDSDFYIDFFERVLKEKKPMKLIISDTNISIDVLIDSFDYKYNAGDEDVNYTLQLTQYKAYSAKQYQLEKEKEVPVQTPVNRVAPPAAITVGRKVLVNGQLFRDSYGGGAGMTLTNYTGVISIIQKGRAKPYHITNLQGGWLGWVSEGSVKGL